MNRFGEMTGGFTHFDSARKRAVDEWDNDSRKYFPTKI